MRVPAGTGAQAEAKLPRAAESDLDRVTLRWGESLESVALAHGTTESKLRALNGLGSPVPPRPGTDLLVPQPAAQKLDSKIADPVVAVVPAQTLALPNRRHVLYEVVWGDALDDVARVLGVSSDELCIWNNVDPSARLHGKMVLQAFVPRDKKLDDVRLLDAKQATLLTVGSPEFFNYFEAKNGRSRQTITVKKGDSWAGLAKKHGLSIGQLERINQRSHYTKLEDGEQLVVYTRRSDAPTRSPATSESADDTLYAASASDASDAPDPPGPLTPELSSPPPASQN
jgi:LysM repeat protein